MDKFASFMGLLGVNLLFVAVAAAAVGLLSITRKAAFAVLKRNFLAYFTSPIGYVFLCLFVWLTAIAAFWTEDFFNSNLANLDQLNRFLPTILLVFIPAITMSIWADERRQGTDELLLTIPAADSDIVLGKYLAAVFIFSVSLLFSEICNMLVLMLLGSPDVGLLLGNYLGYWLAGVAMLSIGMVASFLTSNLTVGFVLGVLFNVPLVAAGYADVVLGSEWGHAISRWSIATQFADFQEGVISLSSVLFFLMVTAVMFYISLVLIGRRHWSGGRDGHSMGGHYLVRSLALILFVGAACVVLGRWDFVRADVTSERLNSLHPDTIALIRNLKSKYPVRVEAFVSRDLPEEYVQKRIDLANILREINAIGGGKVIAEPIHEVELFSTEAARAKSEYGIDSKEVLTQVRGADTKKNVIFGLGVRSGLERVSVPFLGLGTRIEYELVRSIVTVGEAKRKTVGILTTSVGLFATGNPMMGIEPDESQDQPLIQELRKQYRVVKVDPSKPITERYDVLIAPQPSSLDGGQPGSPDPGPMTNFIDAVKRGQPTAIFEDPLPMFFNVPGTSAPKQPPQMMNPMMMPRQQEKGDIQPLWDLLGVKLSATDVLRRGPNGPVLDADVVWQDYNPHESDRDRLDIRKQWVFVTPTSGSDPVFAKDPMVSGLQEVLLLYPGAIKDLGGVNRTYTELIRTNRKAGAFGGQALIEMTPFGQPSLAPLRDVEKKEKPVDSQFVLAVQITRPSESAVEGDKKAAAKDEKKDAADKKDKQDEDKDKKADKDGGLNVVLVADLDLLHGVFFSLRTMGDDPLNPIRKWNLDNVPLVLNIVDHLAGDDRFLNIRKRRPQHRELTTVKSLTEEAKDGRRVARENASKKLDEQEEAEEKRINDKLDELRHRKGGVDQQTAAQEIIIAVTDGKQRIDRAKAELERKRDMKYREIDRELAGKIQREQDRYKMWAVLLPPIPPLLIALCVFLVRRSRESEGESSERMV